MNNKTSSNVRLWRCFHVATICLAVCVLFEGCVHRDTWTSQPTYKFVIQAAKPEQYFVRVPHNGDYPVPPDGRVTLTYSETNKYWESKFGDAIILGGHASSNVRAIFLMKGESVVETITLTPIEDFLLKYDVDNHGYTILNLNQTPRIDHRMGHSHKLAVPVRNTATREATIAFEDDLTYREMQSFHDQMPPLVDYSPKVQRVTERQGKKVFDIVTPPCPKGNVHTWYFDITGTPLPDR